jgi:flagellar biosynthesis protein FliP
MNQKNKKWFILSFILIGLSISFIKVSAQSSISLDFDNTGSASLESLDVVFLLLFLSIIPSLVLMMTSFTRIIIVFSFLRNALGLQQSPPNQILVGLSLFLTLFIMGPVISDINENAYIPYKEQAITQEVALDRAQIPIKEFMLRQVDNESLELFISISKQEVVIDQSQDVNEQMMELDLSILVPAFVTSELKRAFLIGFLIYIPFLAIDLIVASTLMSMGMVMLPPGMISLPFKVMVFILANGWGLLMSSLVQGFH